MIIQETVLITLGSNIKYYESLGYFIPKYTDNKNRYLVKKGTQIEVKVSDLLKSSLIKVLCECDECGKQYLIFYKNIKNEKIICHKCSLSSKSFKEKISKIHTGLKRSDETKRKMSENHWMNGKTGEKSPHWNPNLTDGDRNRSRTTTESNKWKKKLNKEIITLVNVVVISVKN